MTTTRAMSKWATRCRPTVRRLTAWPRSAMGLIRSSGTTILWMAALGSRRGSFSTKSRPKERSSIRSKCRTASSPACRRPKTSSSRAFRPSPSLRSISRPTAGLSASSATSRRLMRSMSPTQTHPISSTRPIPCRVSSSARSRKSIDTEHSSSPRPTRTAATTAVPQCSTTQMDRT